jgi:diadenosine tetraphosphate (Ap4A) HIT family hydrolase
MMQDKNPHLYVNQLRRYDDHCLSCQILQGKVIPPGGIIHKNAFWVYYLRSNPVFTPAEGMIVLRRHCENLMELTRDELATLGLTMRNAEQAIVKVLAPQRVHFGIYAESVKHIHVHVLPRTQTMPASNVQIVVLREWYRWLLRLGIKRAYEDSEVARVAEQIHHAFDRLSFTEDSSHAIR